MIAAGVEITYPAQAAKTNAMDKTETALGLNPRLINKNVKGKDAFLTHNFTHHELFEFFLTGRESTMYL